MSEVRPHILLTECSVRWIVVRLPVIAYIILAKKENEQLLSYNRIKFLNLNYSKTRVRLFPVYTNDKSTLLENYEYIKSKINK